MTDADLHDLYATVRGDCASPLIQAMVILLERHHLAERAMRQLDRQHRDLIDGFYGHRVYQDGGGCSSSSENDAHSRRAGLRGVS